MLDLDETWERKINKSHPQLAPTGSVWRVVNKNGPILVLWNEAGAFGGTLEVGEMCVVLGKEPGHRDTDDVAVLVRGRVFWISSTAWCLYNVTDYLERVA